MKSFSQWFCCFLALTLMIFDMWITHADVTSQYYSPIQPLPWLPCLFGTLGAMLVVAIVWRFPGRAVETWFTVAAVATLFISAILIFVGARGDVPIVRVVGECIRPISSQWFLLLALIPLCLLKRISVFMCVAVSYMASFALRMAFSDGFDYATGLVVFLVCPFAVLLLVRSSSRRAFLEIRLAPSPSAASVLEPRSYLSATHEIFLLILCMGIARGFFAESNMLAFGGTANATVFYLLGIVVLIVMRIRTMDLDRMCIASCTLVILASLMFCRGDEVLCSLGATAFVCGDTLFSTLSWTALCLIVRNNLANGFFLFAWAICASDVGADIGVALCGLSSLLSVPTSYVAIGALTAILYLALSRLCYLDIEHTVKGVKPPSKPKIVEAVSGSIDSKCDLLAKAVGATRRETEVMRLLARGRNVAYIEERLVISRNTVKRHVANIYTKLDVHSQQQLIDRVESQMPDSIDR